MTTATGLKERFYLPSEAMHGTSPSYCPLEEWETHGEVVATVDRPYQYKGHAKSILQVVHHAERFLVAHATQDGIWIELQAQPFRSLRQAQEYAETQATMKPTFERLWD
jgi:hypothetical protein